MQTELRIEAFDGDLVRARRLALGLTIREVTRRAAALVGAWEDAKQSRIERNLQRPTGNDLAVFKVVLGVESIDAFFRSGRPDPAPTPEAAPAAVGTGE